MQPAASRKALEIHGREIYNNSFDNRVSKLLTRSVFPQEFFVRNQTLYRTIHAIVIAFISLFLFNSISIAQVSTDLAGTTSYHKANQLLTAQQLQNAIAFTKAMNYIRFFHPSDEATAADWNSLASEGMRHVEGAKNPSELSEKLKSFFAPYAPTVQFLAPGETQKYLPSPVTPGSESEYFKVRWMHLGVGLNTRPWFHSKREYLSLYENTSAPWCFFYADGSGGFGSLTFAEEYDLGSGIKICLPIVVIADADKKTIPAVETHPKTKEPVNDAAPSGDDRYVRLGNVAIVWGIFQHFYPYFDVVNADWDAGLPLALQSASTDIDGNTFVHTLLRMTAPLKDGHISVFDDASDTYEFPPITLVAISGKLHVKHVETDASGIPLGSSITAIDEEKMEQLAARYSNETSYATEGWLNDKLANYALFGNKDVAIKLTYQTLGGEQKDISLQRNVSMMDYMMNFALHGRPESVSEVAPGIWYVDVSRTDANLFELSLSQLVSAKGIIFDCRTYPYPGLGFGDFTLLGHLHNEFMLSPIIGDPMITDPDRKNWVWRTTRSGIAPKEPQLTCKKVFLTSGAAISASETLLSFVEAYQLGEIIGEPTASTNGSTNGIELPGGYMIPWTGQRILKQDGSTHHGVGIRPTIPVSPTVQGLIEGRDEVLEKALQILAH